MRHNRRLPVIMVLAFVMTLPSIAFARAPLQGRNSKWTVIEFPQDHPVDLDFSVVNPAIVMAFRRERWPSEPPPQENDEPVTDSARADTGGLRAWAKITRGAASTSIKFSLYRFPKNSTYYLYVIDPSGAVVDFFKLNRSVYETSTWAKLNTAAGTFMLALSMSGTLTDIETDKNVFMISQPPKGFRIAPKNP